MTHDIACCTRNDLAAAECSRVEELASAYRAGDADFATWSAGYGVIAHDPLTQTRVWEMVEELVAAGRLPDRATGYRRLMAADRLASAGMWLVAHMTYAQRVRLDGAALEAADFKRAPEGHTGGSLNMVPAYVAYLAMNALDGRTRGWMMGQGHCVAAVDGLNALVGNMTTAHAQRYGLSDAGLTRLVEDFYSYAIAPDGSPASPLGSHVGAHTAGSLQEGGYLGFAELHYVHAPLPGERLVAFLSDGAFEEQRGSDWAPRWWRRSWCSTAGASNSARRSTSRAAIAGSIGIFASTGSSRWGSTVAIRPASRGVSRSSKRGSTSTTRRDRACGTESRKR